LSIACAAQHRVRAGNAYNGAMNAASFNWKPLAGRMLEATLNRALSLDEDTRAGLQPLDGRRVVMQVDAPALALQIQVEGERLRVGPVAAEEAPDLSLRSTLGALMAQLPTLFGIVQDNNGAASLSGMRIEGDAELARRLQTLAAGFDPDWQRPFAAMFGDVLGVQIADAFAGALRQSHLLAANSAKMAAEYLTEESRDIVPKAELDAFYDDVDVLRDDVERLAARVAHLEGTR